MYQLGHPKSCKINRLSNKQIFLGLRCQMNNLFDLKQYSMPLISVGSTVWRSCCCLGALIVYREGMNGRRHANETSSLRILVNVVSWNAWLALFFCFCFFAKSKWLIPMLCLTLPRCINFKHSWFLSKLHKSAKTSTKLLWSCVGRSSHTRILMHIQRLWFFRVSEPIYMYMYWLKYTHCRP